MISELEPVWTQLLETYVALRTVLEEIPDSRLWWRPGGNALPAGYLAQHIARGNLGYACVMLGADASKRPEIEEGLTRASIEDRIATSLEHARGVFEAVSEAQLHTAVADEWEPFDAPVKGPLDAMWFALQMVRHTAYHVGQLNTILLLLEGD